MDPKILDDYLPWILAVIFILLEILDRIGIIDKIFRSLVIGPYKYADNYLPGALTREGARFFLITGELDFIDEPWGQRLLNSMAARSQGGLDVRILVSGDPNKPHVIKRIKRVCELGFTKGDNFLTYFIIGGLQASALNQKECLIKDGDPHFEPHGKKLKNILNEKTINKLAEAENRAEFDYIKKKAEELDPKFLEKLKRKYMGRFNVHWDEKYRFCVKRAIIKRYTEVDLRNLVEGYFGGAPTVKVVKK